MPIRQQASVTPNPDRNPEQRAASDDEIGVLLVDDHEGYRSVAAEVVGATDGFFLVGSAGDAAEAVRLVRDFKARIGLILLDVNLGPDDGVELARQLTGFGADVVLVTALHIDDLPVAARDCGARGYVPKAELSPAALTRVCRGVYDWPGGEITGGVGRRS